MEPEFATELQDVALQNLLASGWAVCEGVKYQETVLDPLFKGFTKDSFRCQNPWVLVFLKHGQLGKENVPYLTPRSQSAYAPECFGHGKYFPRLKKGSDTPDHEKIFTLFASNHAAFVYRSTGINCKLMRQVSELESIPRHLRPQKPKQPEALVQTSQEHQNQPSSTLQPPQTSTFEQRLEMRLQNARIISEDSSQQIAPTQTRLQQLPSNQQKQQQQIQRNESQATLLVPVAPSNQARETLLQENQVINKLNVLDERLNALIPPDNHTIEQIFHYFQMLHSSMESLDERVSRIENCLLTISDFIQTEKDKNPSKRKKGMSQEQEMNLKKPRKKGESVAENSKKQVFKTSKEESHDRKSDSDQH